jgi:hypothetical protein
VGPSVTYRAEVEDPVTGESLTFEADTEAELDDLIDQQFEIAKADQDDVANETACKT